MVCAHCGGELKPSPRARIVPKKFCSQACSRIAHNIPHRRFTEQDIRDIRAASASGDTAARLAYRYDVSAPTMTRILRGQSYKWVS